MFELSHTALQSTQPIARRQSLFLGLFGGNTDHRQHSQFVPFYPTFSQKTPPDGRSSFTHRVVYQAEMFSDQHARLVA
jgi:hypothetical protein